MFSTGVSGGPGAASLQDFVAGSGVLSFAAGEVSKTISVTTLQDTPFELDETFSLTLSSPSQGAVIQAGSAQGSIVNDDPVPLFSIGASGDKRVALSLRGSEDEPPCAPILPADLYFFLNSRTCPKVADHKGLDFCFQIWHF